MNYYLIIGVLASVSALISTWMYFASRAHVGFKVLFGTLSLALTITVWLLLPNIMAAPIEGYPPTKSPIISSYLTEDHQTIYLWVKTNNGFRSYVIHNPGSDKKGNGKKGDKGDPVGKLAKELKNGYPGMTLEVDGNGNPVLVNPSMPPKRS